jgi:hypothetical protein
MRYSTAARGRVGKPFHPPVTRVDFVFTLGDGTSIPYVCLHLDTKEGSEPDGNPTHQMYDYAERPEWGSAIRYLVETKGNKWPVVLTNGQALSCTAEEFVEQVGQMMVDILKSARDQSLFKDLPKGGKCEFGVEDFGGGFGWPRYEDRGKENLA